jgi:hypothetical protein
LAEAFQKGVVVRHIRRSIYWNCLSDGGNPSRLIGENVQGRHRQADGKDSG